VGPRRVPYHASCFLRQRARDEVVIAFELTEVFETYAEFESAENTKLRVAALQQEADAMKARANKEWPTFPLGVAIL
jgi:hypothetical protein